MQLSPAKSTKTLLRQNLRLVKQLYPGIPVRNLVALRYLTMSFGISVSVGRYSEYRR